MTEGTQRHEAFKAALQAAVAVHEAEAKANGTFHPPGTIWERKEEERLNARSAAALMDRDGGFDSEESRDARRFYKKLAEENEVELLRYQQWKAEQARWTSDYTHITEGIPDFEALRRVEVLELARQKEKEAFEHLLEREGEHGRRETAFLRVIRKKTGRKLDAKVRQKSNAARAKQQEQSIKIACNLEAAGLRGFGDGPQMWIIDMIRERAIPVPKFANSVLIPSTAQKKRGKLRKELKHLLAKKHHRFDAMVTLTWGQRVPLRVETNGAEVRAAYSDLSRRVSNFNKLGFQKDYGTRIQFRGNEAGELKRDENGVPTVHCHSHTLMNFSKWLPSDWDQFLGKTERQLRAEKGRPSRIRYSPNRMFKLLVYRPIHGKKARRDGTQSGRFWVNMETQKIVKTEGAMAEWCRHVWEAWGAGWSMDGAINTIEEVTKYTMKGDDLETLSVSETAALYAAMYKMRRVQKLGEFRAEGQRQYMDCKRIEMMPRRTPDGEETVPEEMPDWNAQVHTRRKTAAEIERKRRRAARRRAEKAAAIQRNAERRAELLRLARAMRAGEQMVLPGFESKSSPPPLPLIINPMPPPVDQAARAARQAKYSRPAFRNRLVARQAPGWWHPDDEYATPAFAVWSDSRPDIALLIKEKSFAKDAVAVARREFTRVTGIPALSMRVHTSPVTGHENAPFLPAILDRRTWFRPENEPEPPPNGHEFATTTHQNQ